MLPPFPRLTLGLQAVSPLGQSPRALAGPTQGRLRVSPRHWVDPSLQLLQQHRILDRQRLAPPPARAPVPCAEHPAPDLDATHPCLGISSSATAPSLVLPSIRLRVRADWPPPPPTAVDRARREYLPAVRTCAELIVPPWLPCHVVSIRSLLVQVIRGRTHTALRASQCGSNRRGCLGDTRIKLLAGSQHQYQTDPQHWPDRRRNIPLFHPRGCALGT